MSEKVGAIITGGDFQALGLVRTLAKKDIPVILLDCDHCIGRYSKYVKKFFKSPRLSNVNLYIDFMVTLAKKEKLKGWIIFPNSDEAVYLLSKNKAILGEYFRIPTPEWEIIQNVYIKKNTYQIAEKHNIPIPHTCYPDSVEELSELDFNYPVVIKPSIRDHFYKKVKIKAFLIRNKEELLKTYLRVCQIIPGNEVLVQDFIPGGPKFLYSFCPFFKDGKVVASITARRTRQHPMDFGHATTLAELVEIPELQKISENFLKVINYYGIGEVEFMFDSRDGKYKLIEVNPRIWGWHTLAIGAGVDLPYYMYLDSIGEKIELNSKLTNLKWVRLTTDIPTVFIEIAKGRMKIRDYISSMKGKKEFAVFALSDPLPFFAEIAMIPYLWIKRGF